jgi:prepilin-type N-terminal cleavage/methylation domain-containing protein
MMIGMSTCGRRQGFTLLEVMVALVLTGIVVLVAYAAAQAGIDARTRVASGLRAVQSSRSAREILRDALRNARAPQDSSDLRGGFVLTNNKLSFVAAGGATPLDPDFDWRFTVVSDHGHVRITAVAVGHADPAGVTFLVPDATRWTVWMLGPDGTTWQAEWSEADGMPRAVVVAFWNGDRLSAWPLHLSLWPGSTPTATDSLQVGGGAASQLTRTMWEDR